MLFTGMSFDKVLRAIQFSNKVDSPVELSLDTLNQGRKRAHTIIRE